MLVVICCSSKREIINTTFKAEPKAPGDAAATAKGQLVLRGFLPSGQNVGGGGGGLFCEFWGFLGWFVLEWACFPAAAGFLLSNWNKKSFIV